MTIPGRQIVLTRPIRKQCESTFLEWKRSGRRQVYYGDFTTTTGRQIRHGRYLEQINKYLRKI